MSASELTRPPLVGLSTYKEQAQTLAWDTEFALLHYAYVQLVSAAGGVPVLLPPQDDHAAEPVVERLDALVLTGGADVDPARYQGFAQPESSYRPERDSWETALLTAALERDIPVLGVCRGLQLINVALGGTLEQHVPDRVGHDRHRPAPGRFSEIDVRVEGGSLLNRLVGDRITVSCHHHQALLTPARSLRAVAHAQEDGTVEAAEDPDREFLLGVQWHPEQDSVDLRLFTGLIRAAQRRAHLEPTAVPQR